LTEAILNPVGVKSGAVREGNRVKTALAAPIYREAREPYVRKSSSHGSRKIGVVPSERRSMSAASYVLLPGSYLLSGQGV